MTRLRATLARSDADRDLHRQIAEAARYVAKAQDVCLRVSRNRDPALQTEAQRARQTQQALNQVRTLLDRIGYFTPGFDRGDPDLVSEAAKQVETERQRQSERKKQAGKRAEKKQRASPSPEQRIRDALGKMRDHDGPE